MTIAESFVERWHAFPTEEIPLRIFQRAALCVEDTLAVAFAATGLGIGNAATTVASATGPGTATIWGTPYRVSAGEAAFANGARSHALDYDDLHPAAIMHSSAFIVPTAIALGEQTGASGRDVLAAAIIGYEIAARLGRMAPGSFQENGFQSTAVLGVFGATAIASRLLRLDKRQAVNALGIAGSMAAGLMEFLADGSDVKQMHPGWASHGGIRAAQLAAAGFTGPATVFEGRFGIFRSYVGREVSSEGTADFDGSHWEVEDMAPKPYPACLCVHPQVQAILDLRARGEVSAERIDEIREIRCDVPSFYVGLVYEPAQSKVEIRTAYEARFSAAYCIARALIDGCLDITSFSPEKLKDPVARAIAKKITYRPADLPEFPASFPARVSVTTISGRSVESYIAHNLGSPANPFTPEQFAEKFQICVEPLLGKAASSVLWRTVRALPDAPDIRVLSGMLRNANEPPAEEALQPSLTA